MDVLLQKTVTLVVSAGFALIALLVAGCGESARRGYRTENGAVVLYTGWPAERTIVGKADARSFVRINDTYGKDKSQVFYLGRIMPNADPATFTYLAGSYAKDQRNGYTRDQLISHDGAHFTIVPNPDETPTNGTAAGIAYARDSHRVYKDTWIIDGADPATFAVVPMFNGNYLTHDRYRVWVNEVPIAGADGATFRKVSDFHFADNRRAWGLVLGKDTRWLPIACVDLATFRGIGSYHATDTQRVYFGNEAIAGADPATFQETDYLTGKDKNGTYSSGYGTRQSARNP